MATAYPPAAAMAISPPRGSHRVESIDLLRGLVMVIMALDHVRDYFHYAALQYDPLDLDRTSTMLYFTRWITHFCAPVFMFLSGTSAYLVGIRKGKKALSRFLLTRGIWLVILELTVVNFGWYFNYPVSIDFLVIWALGISMIALAALVYLPLPAIAVIGLLMVFGHNAFDNASFPADRTTTIFLSFLHRPYFQQIGDLTLFIGYPIIPWIGVMALGYSLGKLYEQNRDAVSRKKWLLVMGVSALLLFAGLRYSNLYGDPVKWTGQKSDWFTFLSFLNVAKYPPSLLYLLVTLGPALIILSLTENSRGWLSQKIKVIGRVPMFYYIVHIYLIHLAALFATYFCGFDPGDMILDTFVLFDPKLRGYGFSLGITYAVWFVLVILLYFLCRWYDRFKRSRSYWWLSYL